jgi:hypothetical protein
MKTIFDNQEKRNNQRKYNKTIGEKLNWALANIKMAEQAHKKGSSKYSEFYNVRSCIYNGFMDDKKKSRT